MSKKKWYVEYRLQVSDVRVIEADSEEEAERLANEMRFDCDYWNGICEGMENDWDQWRSKYAEIEVLDEAPADMEADNEEE